MLQIQNPLLGHHENIPLSQLLRRMRKQFEVTPETFRQSSPRFIDQRNGWHNHRYVVVTPGCDNGIDKKTFSKACRSAKNDALAVEQSLIHLCLFTMQDHIAHSHWPVRLKRQ